MGNPDAADAIHRLDERMNAAGKSRACPQAQGSTFRAMASDGVLVERS